MNNSERFNYLNFISIDNQELDETILSFEFVPIAQADIIRFKCENNIEEIINFLENKILKEIEYFIKNEKRFSLIIDFKKVVYIENYENNSLEIQIWR